jgi:hypothetical protein
MSIVCHYFKSTLQSYKIVVNNEPKARKKQPLYEGLRKHTRELRQLLQRSRATSLQKFGNYSGIVWKPDEWLVSTPAVYLANGRVELNVVFGVYVAISPSGWHHYGFFLAAIYFNG